MKPAWLDSLSEDWISEPRSDASQAQLTRSSSTSQAQVTSMTSQTSAQPEPRPRGPASRIPRLSTSPKKANNQAAHESSIALAERSLSQINIAQSQRGASKQTANQAKTAPQRRAASSSFSACSEGSVVHNTVHHNGSSSRPNQEDVPEWKRRLVYGDLSYGETKDLFTSAGTGLENMFKPPAAPSIPQQRIIEENESINPDMTLPSSPPPYKTRSISRATECEDTIDESSGGSVVRHPNDQRKKTMQFRCTDDDTHNPDERSLSPADETNFSTRDSRPKPFASNNLNISKGVSRKVTSHSVIGNEDFSPILISRHNTENGKLGFAPVDLPAQQLQKRLETLRRNQMVLDENFDMSSRQEIATEEDEAQTEDSTANFIKNGGYLNTRRGGRSEEGSFRHRPLSPPLNTDTSEMLPESSLQASTPKQFPTIRTDRFPSAQSYRPQSPPSPAVPAAPHPSPEKHLQLPNHNTSPLKLFGPYDTYTNQTLLRRISQFEDQMTESLQNITEEESVAIFDQDLASNPEANKNSVPRSLAGEAEESSSQRQVRLANGFGDGQLDGFEFSEDISVNPSDKSLMENKENLTPERESLPPLNPIKFEIHQDLSSEDASRSTRWRRRQRSNTGSSSRHSLRVSKGPTRENPAVFSEPAWVGFAAQTTPRREGSEGKRPRTSPSKDPTPKRRRTLHETDIAYGLEDHQADALESVQSSHRHMQSAIGSSDPVSPSPQQRSSAFRGRQPLTDIQSNADNDEDFTSSPCYTPDGDQDVNGLRKPSMKTQDFFNAAEEIMAMIRNKARPKTSLGSLAEDEGEYSGRRYSSHSAHSDASSYQESTKEPLSRPPSRDGAPVPRMPKRQEDPDLADRLRKYQESTEMDQMITYSMQSMGRIKDVIEETNMVNESIQQSIRHSQMRHSSPADTDADIISDLPNVRLSRNPDHLDDVDKATDFVSHRSHSSGVSSGRSFPSNSSRGSDSRRLIGPDIVSGLIGDHVGNMVFDKQNKTWVKVKTAHQPTNDVNERTLEDSEEDPFASIPDLSVDTTKENQNLDFATKPDLRDLEQFLDEDDSPARPTKSIGETQAVDQKDASFVRAHEAFSEPVGENQEVEHEISIHEDRSHRSNSTRRRNLTITFSSPIASVIRDVAPDDEEFTEGELSGLERTTGDAGFDSLKRGRHTNFSKYRSSSTSNSKSRSRSRGPTRSMSVGGGQAYLRRPVSRIDEQDEDSTVMDQFSDNGRQVSICADSSVLAPPAEDQANNSMSLLVATPGPTRSPQPSATPIIGKYVGTLSLSPLSEFTVNHDQSYGLEVSYMMGGEYLVTGDGSKKIQSKALRNLVEKITEVEPFEPDWDSMRELDISHKQLTTLHKLNEFCNNIVSLDVSDNAIDHLEGVPETVRNLKITNNRLSELTAWGHLANLQYIDVSNNGITSLYAFKDLVHLRSLRADNNEIASLEGIKLHDSLQALRVRGNCIRDVDFEGTRLHKLTDLDLEGNLIESIENIEELSSLATLNLQHNRLSAFGPSSGCAVANLKYLKLSHNAVQVLNLAAFPALRLVHADRNRLTGLAGFSRCRRLDSLSLREQQTNGRPLDLSFLSSAYEVRKLFLSGNVLAGEGHFDLPVDFLNLQFLELANCGLRSLGSDLGQLMPNLRVLNLNFNALEELEPLRYIPRLKKLLVAGNRLADARAFTQVLKGFPHLARLDARDNLATLGFYPPSQALVPTEGENDDGSGPCCDPFTLPDVHDRDRDERFAGRLDMGTRMRRRLYEMVVLARCERLKMLDGLSVDRERVDQRDDVWKALVEKRILSFGAVQGEQDTEDDENTPVNDEGTQSMAASPSLGGEAETIGKTGAYQDEESEL